MKGTLLLCTILGLQVGLIKSQWTPASLPNPQTEPGRCGRSDVPRSWVCDPDGMLSKRSGDVIEGVLKDIAAATPPYLQAAACGGSRLNAGYQVAVVAARSIEVPQGADEGEAAQQFAAELMDRWGVGDAWCNDGVLLLLTLQPRQVAIYAGRGSKRQISAKPIKQIIGRMRPLLQEQRYGEALEGAAVDVGIALAGGSTPGGDGGGLSLRFFLALLFFVGVVGVFATIIISIITCIRRSRSANRRSRPVDRTSRPTATTSRTCQLLIDKLQREQAAALSSKQYPSETCPICLEDFQRPGQDSQPSAPPLNPDTDNQEVKIWVKEEASGEESSSTDLKAKLLGERRDCSSDRQEVEERYCKPLVLTCGHSFCEDCLSEWMASNDTCPICRASLTQQPLPPATATCLPQQQQQAGAVRVGMQQMADDIIQEELLFRLRSVQRMFPQEVTGDVMYNWDQQVRRGDPLSWTAVRAAQLAPEMHQQHAFSGAWGASTRIGGGTSSGGGGASGSWSPPVVTKDVKNGRGQQARRQDPPSWTAVRTAQLEPESQQQHADSGFWGASSNFGGGTSSGGGGASGGW